MDVASAREKRSLVKQGAIRGMSIGYEAIKWTFDAVEKVRHLKEIKLWEISLVVFPADSAAQVARIKGVPYTDFGGLLDMLNELDIKEIDGRFQEAAKRAADRIYALLKSRDASQEPPGQVDSQPANEPDYGSLFASLEKLNQTLSKGGK